MFSVRKRIASILGVAATVGLMSLGLFASPASASTTCAGVKDPMDLMICEFELQIHLLLRTAEQ